MAAANPLAEPLVDTLYTLREAQLMVQNYRTVYLITLKLLAAAQHKVKAQERTIARLRLTDFSQHETTVAYRRSSHEEAATENHGLQSRSSLDAER